MSGLREAVAQEESCRICGAAASAGPALRKNDHDVVRCPACGVGRAVTAEFQPERFYTDAYFSGGTEGAYVDYAGSEAVLRREFKTQVAFLRRFVSGGTLLEIGCAYGFFLQEAKPYFAVHGVEMAEGAVAHCHRTGLSTVRQGALSAELLDSIGPLDAIVLLDVIEHIDDVPGTLALAVERLRPGGVVLLTTGDWSSLFARLTGARWRLMTPPLHLWYFTPLSLERLFVRLGCRRVHLSHPWKLVPLDLIVDQLALMTGWRKPGHLPAVLQRLGLPANLFDAMRLVFRKEEPSRGPRGGLSRAADLLSR
jgi:SAM-dependent methyltransferase